MKTIYTTVFLYPTDIKTNDLRAAIIEAKDEPKVNEWHKAISSDNFIGTGQLVYNDDDIHGYHAYATLGNNVQVPSELHGRILEAIDSTANMDCEGPYKQVDIGDCIVDILWWHLEDE